MSGLAGIAGLAPVIADVRRHRMNNDYQRIRKIGHWKCIVYLAEPIRQNISLIPTAGNGPALENINTGLLCLQHAFNGTYSYDEATLVNAKKYYQEKEMFWIASARNMIYSKIYKKTWYKHIGNAIKNVALVSPEIVNNLYEAQSDA